MSAPYDVLAHDCHGALAGLDVAATGDVARVRDGHDTWLCDPVALVRTLTGPAGSRGYTDVCVSIPGVVVSLNGTSRGSEAERRAMVRMAIRDGLIDADEDLALGAS